MRYPKWFEYYWKSRKALMLTCISLGLLSLFLLPRVQLNFAFEQFFPKEDEDLSFYLDFIEAFESDDNFLLIAFEREPDFFDSSFLNQVDFIADSLANMPYVEQVQSITNLINPIKTPMGPLPTPFINRQNPDANKKQVLNDPRFAGRLYSEDGKHLLIFAKTINNINLNQAREIRSFLDPLMEAHAPQPFHCLGRIYFQTELVQMQMNELAKSTILSALLIGIVMFFLYRKLRGILISLSSILLSLIIFFGFIVLIGGELNIMSALFPIIMIIVATSDVIHIMTKYLYECDRGISNKAALYITIKEIGLATLFTSLTTAAGFVSLATSKIESIQYFGLYAAAGVVLAFILVILFTCSWLSYYSSEDIRKRTSKSMLWESGLQAFYKSVKHKSIHYSIGTLLFLGMAIWGIQKISTNYNIKENLPNGYKVTDDFMYFERVFGGYRPLEFAIFSDENILTNYAGMSLINALADTLRSEEQIHRVYGPDEPYLWLNYYENNNKPTTYQFPESEEQFNKYQVQLDQMQFLPISNPLLSQNKKKARVSSIINDIGADSIQEVQSRISNHFESKAQALGIQIRATGTGLILDKNSEYIRESIVLGLGLAIGIVALLMAFLFKSFRILFLTIITNLIPLLIAAALLGYTHTELEAGISIIFAVVFGIAVDDTIHFMSKFKLALNRKVGVENALLKTYQETGKAIIITSMILFAGFMVLFFSDHSPTQAVGWLIAITLLFALLADLIVLPILIRIFYKKKADKNFSD